MDNLMTIQPFDLYLAQFSYYHEDPNLKDDECKVLLSADIQGSPKRFLNEPLSIIGKVYPKAVTYASDIIDLYCPGYWWSDQGIPLRVSTTLNDRRMLRRFRNDIIVYLTGMIKKISGTYTYSDPENIFIGDTIVREVIPVETLDNTIRMYYPGLYD